MARAAGGSRHCIAEMEWLIPHAGTPDEPWAAGWWAAHGPEGKEWTPRRSFLAEDRRDLRTSEGDGGDANRGEGAQRRPTEQQPTATRNVDRR